VGAIGRRRPQGNSHGGTKVSTAIHVRLKVAQRIEHEGGVFEVRLSPILGSAIASWTPGSMLCLSLNAETVKQFVPGSEVVAAFSVNSEVRR
jgi:hypothetical protein